MAITATFIPGANVLAKFGDALDNTIMTSRNAAGNLLVNGGAVAVHGSTATVANTSLIQRTALRRPTTYDVVIVGGGAGGISTASSLRRRRAGLSIAIIEPRETHYYQPGWTLVGGGVFDRSQTERPMARVMPNGVKWIRSAVAEFAPEQNAVVLEDGERVSYRTLIVAAGIELNWDGVEGLRETLGKNGVTSNYMFEMAPYTFELVRSLRKGRALFSQPPMPIKCAGAPQKAMYLSCDHWLRDGVLNNIEVEFHLAGPVLFGVNYYVPSLMRYVERYGAKLNFTSNLKAIDGPGKKAFFEVKSGESAQIVERSFDMLHVCPPQRAPKVIRESALADKAGWVEVDPATLQHPRYGNIFAVGDVSSAPNAKTAAAVRKQAPVVAENTLRVLDGQAPRAVYDGYGSCPLTVERGKIVLAEFGYGGKLLPTFRYLDGKKPSRLAWFLKEKMLPTIYWELMLKGHEWLARPEMLPHRTKTHTFAPADPDRGEKVMDRLDNSPKARLTSAPDRRLLGRSTIAALVLIAAAGLVVTALFVSNAGRAGHSPGGHAEQTLELRSEPVRIERGGTWHHYDPLY